MKPIYFTTLLAIIVLGCTSKYAPYLDDIKTINYDSNWSELNNYPVEYGRSDDLHFFDKNTGFVINSEGYLSYTINGGDTWEIVHENEGTFFRCITFKNRQEGWLGTIGTDDPYLSSTDTVSMYETKDGGLTWTPVKFIGPNPKGLCGLQKVNDTLIVGCGRVRGPSYFIKTTDGGANWYSQNLDHVAGSLIAAHFFDEDHGLLIGGTTKDRENSKSLVLETKNGGSSWDTIYMSTQIGEYPWKFAFPSRDHGFISIQRNVQHGEYYHLQTIDGGKNWKEVIHSDNYYYVQGIGFANEKVGFMGGSSGKTFQTRDGGQTWLPYANIGNGFNNFQFFEDGSGYGVGYGVFKCDDIENKSSPTETYYDNGKLEATFPLIDGKKNGLSISYYPDGNLKSKGVFQNNVKIGKWKYYSETGQLTDEESMKNGSIKYSIKKLANLVGVYKAPDGISRTITLDKGILFSQRESGAILPIIPERSNVFYFAFNPNVRYEFIRDAKGVVVGANFIRDGGMTELVKI